MSTETERADERAAFFKELLKIDMDQKECMDCGEPFQSPAHAFEDRRCVDCMMTSSDRRSDWHEKMDGDR